MHIKRRRDWAFEYPQWRKSETILCVTVCENITPGEVPLQRDNSAMSSFFAGSRSTIFARTGRVNIAQNVSEIFPEAGDVCRRYERVTFLTATRNLFFRKGSSLEPPRITFGINFVCTRS